MWGEAADKLPAIRCGDGRLIQARGLRNRFKHFPVWKYCRSTDLKFWLQDETVRLSSLASFAASPANGGFGDPAEVVIQAGSGHLGDPGKPHYDMVVQNARRFGIAMDANEFGAPRNVYINRITKRKANRLAFCCTDELKRDAFLRWRALENYDAVIQIRNIHVLMHALLEADQKQGNRLGGFVHWDQVQYLDFPIRLDTEPLSALEFIKERGPFAWQSEVRCYFDGVDETAAGEWHTVHVPGLANLVQVVKVPPAWLSPCSERAP